MDKEWKNASPKEMRERFSEERLVMPTAGLCPGYVQANLVILQGDLAGEYLKFLRKNPKPCPVLEVIQGERPISKTVAPGADIAKEFPLYRVYRKGALTDEPTDISHLWTPDMTAVLIGCSLTFEARLLEAGIRMAHYDHNKRVPMYDTNIACEPYGHFKGNYVVSMRPIPEKLVDLAVQITEPMEYAHGGPVHIGDPAAIGIRDLLHPDYGDPPVVAKGDVPVFWACGVTAQSVAMQAKPELVVAHSPGYMLITDVVIPTLH